MKKLFIYLFIICSTSAFAQVVIPYNLTPDPKAELEVRSTDKGVLIPQLTSLQMYAIASPANGLWVYNTDAVDFECYTGSSWDLIGKTPSYASDPAVKYEGECYFNTTDNLLHYWDGTAWIIVGVTVNTL